MARIDIGWFDFDRHNALYYFIMNADEHIYMRYGGRDSESASTYLNLRSLELALEQGLELHAAHTPDQNVERPEPLYPRDIPLLKERTLSNGRCVECHLIGDYQNLHKEMDGTLDRITDMFTSPDIKRIGIHLKVSKGLLVEEAKAAVAEAGMQTGDTIMQLNGRRVWTFADLQYHYDKVPRSAKSFELVVQRDNQPVTLKVALPARWWVTDLDYRHWSVDPKLYFKTTPLSPESKAKLKLAPNGFAGKVIHRDFFADFADPPIKKGDIIYGVEDVFIDELADTPDLHIKLHHTAGSELKVHVLRGEDRFVSDLKTERQDFRK